MATANGFEQETLELINSARMDPQGDFARYLTSYDPLTSNDARIQSALNFFQVDGAVLKAQVDALTAAAPLAWATELNESATKHSQRMIDADEQSHNLPGEPDLGTRVRDEGYQFRSLGENIFAFTDSALQGHAAFMVDWGFTSTGIQTPPGHRDSIMNGTFREVGVGAIEETNPNTGVGPWVVTHHLATRGGLAETILLGVAFNDGNGDDFYTAGEGRGGLTVAVAGSGSVATAAAGGYRMDTTAGTKTVTLSGGGIQGSITLTADFLAENAKIDVQDGDTVKASVSVNLGQGGKHGVLYGQSDLTLTGNFAGNELTGNAGNNLIAGSHGNDKLYGAAGGDELQGAQGADWLYGGDGWDLLVGGQGKDVQDGGRGSDTLNGAKGDDVLFGRGHDDVLIGGLGNDRMNGGWGADEFRMYVGHGKDLIRGFEKGIDTLALDDALWSGTLNQWQVRQNFAAQEGNDTVFRFDGGEVVRLEDTSIAGIFEDLLIL